MHSSQSFAWFLLAAVSIVCLGSAPIIKESLSRTEAFNDDIENTDIPDDVWYKRLFNDNKSTRTTLGKVFTTDGTLKTQRIMLGSTVLDAATLRSLHQNKLQDNMIIGEGTDNTIVSLPSGTSVGDWDIHVIPVKFGSTKVEGIDSALQHVDVHTTTGNTSNSFKLVGKYWSKDKAAPSSVSNMIYIGLRRPESRKKIQTPSEIQTASQHSTQNATTTNQFWDAQHAQSGVTK